MLIRTEHITGGICFHHSDYSEDNTRAKGQAGYTTYILHETGVKIVLISFMKQSHTAMVDVQIVHNFTRNSPRIEKKSQVNQKSPQK